MPPKSPKKANVRKSPVTTSKPREVVLTLPCEWADCNEVYSDMDKYTTHIQTHLFSLLYGCIKDSGNFSVIVCQWRICGSETLKDFMELVRHVYFHAFHAKLKSLGQTVQVGKECEPCILDSSSRNMVPELPDRMHCMWKFCEYIFDNVQVFYLHVGRHADVYMEGNDITGGAKCEWDSCGLVFKSKHKLREHLRSHTQEKMVACPTCGGFFVSNAKYIDHLNRQRKDTCKNLQCSNCNKWFSTERLLRDHIRHHVNYYKCPLCDMTCPASSSMRHHIKKRHTNEKPFKCSQCPAAFHHASDLRLHHDTHTVTLYKCHVEACPYQCQSYSSLSKHFKYVHQGVKPSKYCCHVCPSFFTRGNKLTAHLKKKHKFKWPSGHKRFRYKMHEDGCFRLQTIRYHSLELTKQILIDKMRGENANSTTSQHPVDLSATPQKDSAASSDEKSAVVMTPSKDDFTYNLEMLGEVALSERKKGSKRRVTSRGAVKRVAKQIVLDGMFEAKTEQKGKTRARQPEEEGGNYAESEESFEDDAVVQFAHMSAVPVAVSQITLNLQETNTPAKASMPSPIKRIELTSVDPVTRSQGEVGQELILDMPQALMFSNPWGSGTDITDPNVPEGCTSIGQMRNTEQSVSPLPSVADPSESPDKVFHMIDAPTDVVHDYSMSTLNAKQEGCRPKLEYY